jgi:sugar (pentulose or hexulose) kinase
MPITVLDVAEAGCMGVAMLAKAHHDQTDVKDIARKWVKPVSVVYPEKHSHYNTRFQQYRELYHKLRSIYLKI